MCNKAPTPPDPKATAAASTSTNIGTAIANANMGNVNQVTPEGNLTYGQTGTYKWTDPYTNNSYDIPQYTATQTLSPSGQATLDQTDAAKLGMATTAHGLIDTAGANLATPVDLSSANLDKYTNSHFLDDFTKQWDTQKTNLDQSLVDRGIRLGSDAFTKSEADFSTNRGNALDNMLGSSEQNAQSAILAERNQPLNELSALLSSSQVQQPNYVNANEPTIPTTNTAGIINQNYQDQVIAYNTNQQQMGGLFSDLFSGSTKFLL